MRIGRVLTKQFQLPGHLLLELGVTRIWVNVTSIRNASPAVFSDMVELLDALLGAPVVNPAVFGDRVEIPYAGRNWLKAEGIKLRSLYSPALSVKPLPFHELRSTGITCMAHPRSRDLSGRIRSTVPSDIDRRTRSGTTERVVFLSNSRRSAGNRILAAKADRFEMVEFLAKGRRSEGWRDEWRM